GAACGGHAAEVRMVAGARREVAIGNVHAVAVDGDFGPKARAPDVEVEGVLVRVVVAEARDSRVAQTDCSGVESNLEGRAAVGRNVRGGLQGDREIHRVRAGDG